MSASARVVTEGAASEKGRGGSTFHFDLDQNHPLLEEVYAFLGEIREKASNLRSRIEKTDGEKPHAVGPAVPISFYAGQTVVNELAIPKSLRVPRTPSRMSKKYPHATRH